LESSESRLFITLLRKGISMRAASGNLDVNGDGKVDLADVLHFGSKGLKWFAGSFPGIPVDATVKSAMETPADASCYERTRDTILRFFVYFQNLFAILAVVIAIVFVLDICVIVVAFWGAVFGVGVLGPDSNCDVDVLRSFDGCLDSDLLKDKGLELCTTTGFNVSYEGNAQFPPKLCLSGYTYPDTCTGEVQYVDEYCNLSQWLFNVCIKVIVISITYVNTLPLAWRMAIMVDAWAEVVEAVTGINVDKRESGIGLDFYARKTDAMWFHIPMGKRAYIATLLVLAIIFQILNLVFAIVYWAYIDTQTSPGVLLINIPALFSIICQVASGVVQGKEEAKLIEAQPDKFPAPFTRYLGEGLQEWRKGNGMSLWATVKSKKEQFDREQGHKKPKTAGAMMGMMEIEVSKPENV